MNKEVYRNLRKHSEILERIGVGSSQVRAITPNGVSVVNTQTLAEIFDIQNVYVVDAIYNSAAEGATAVYAYVLTDSVWIGYVSPTPALDARLHVHLPGRSAYRATYREDAYKQDVVEAAIVFDCKATCLAAGGLLTNVL